MASPKRAMQLGPFMKGLNTFSDPSAVPDDGLAELLNMELDLDGSLVSRPPFHDTGIDLPLDSTGNMILLGLFYTPAGAEYLIASDGFSKTYYLSGGSWVLLTNTFAATAMTQFDDKAWLLAPTSSANPGGYWSPTLGFVAEPNMPKGTVIVAFKFRLWVAQGEQATANGSRLYFSKLLGITPFWPVAPEFIDIARGDGQNIVAIERYYESLLIFRTNSIYKFSYNSDPATGSIEVSVPNVGLTSRWAIESHENYFYFFYDDRAYEYLNGRAQVISQAIKFQTSGGRSGFVVPIAVSVFNNRALFTFYDTLYVFSLVTRTWSRWRTPSRGGIGRILERRNADLPNPQAYAMRAIRPLGATDAPLYRITDAITTDHEDFQCIVRTKILSMDTPQLYKRLFWWGLDGIFRMEARGTALPIVYGGSVTWGELYTKGITWGQLLFGTWGRPVAQGLSVETIRPELGATAQRKFTKFMKKMRFRQIQFQVVFNTRGDDQTAPVRLFSLHAEVTPAQTVSKAIS